jgi:hypothetical protein
MWLYLQHCLSYVNDFDEFAFLKTCVLAFCFKKKAGQMKSWTAYRQEAMDYLQEGDRRFFPGDSDDIWTRWPGREDDMVKFYLPEAHRHFATLQAKIYPEYEKELRILMELALAHANLPLNALERVRSGSEHAANEEEFAPVLTMEL